MTSVACNTIEDKYDDSSDSEHTFKRKSRPKDLLDNDSEDEDSPLKIKEDKMEGSEDEVIRPKISKSRLKTISNSSDSDSGNSDDQVNKTDSGLFSVEKANEDDSVLCQSNKSKSRLITNSNNTDSDSGNSNDQITETNSRVSIKKAKLKSKFNKLHEKNKAEDQGLTENDVDSNLRSSDSDESNSLIIDDIKKKIKARNNYLKTSLCDPDTSDEETEPLKPTMKTSMQRSIQVISPKPEKKMTSKQAIENMQRIKSESNRMLREKDVSLPYHRPKALFLKDIINKKKLSIAANGKCLPIKMSTEQLQEYAKMLEERQKEVIKLCKSDSENEEQNDQVEENKKQEQTTEHSYDSSENKTTEIKCHEDSESILTNSELIPTKDLEQAVGNIEQNASTLNNCTHSKIEETINSEIKDTEKNTNVRSDSDSQFLHLHFASENPEGNSMPSFFTDNRTVLGDTSNIVEVAKEVQAEHNSDTSHQNIDTLQPEPKLDKPAESNERDLEASFSDDDINYEEIEKLIENAEVVKDNQNSMLLSNGQSSLNLKPRLTGRPGMVIDLNTDTIMPIKLSGVELFKERYTYFAKLKTPEELERQKNQKIKPGLQFLKLKQELEEEMAVQRSLEWSKREQENQLCNENSNSDNDETDLSKLEEKLLDEDVEPDNNESSESEDLEENDCDMEDKPRKHNPMVDDEAEESDTEAETPRNVNEGNHEDTHENDSSEHETDSDDESSESEMEEAKPRKNRILKAFEDSDEEEVKEDVDDVRKDGAIIEKVLVSKGSQDEDIQLAQLHKSFSEDLFSTQESGNGVIEKNDIKLINNTSEKTAETQTFSILHSSQEEFQIDKSQKALEELKAIAPDIPVITSQDAPDSQVCKTQGFGEDVLALCTGNFFNNEFVTQAEGNNFESKPTYSNDFSNSQTNLPQTQEIASLDVKCSNDETTVSKGNEHENLTIQKFTTTKGDKVENCNLLKSILDELDSPNFDEPKQKFFSNTTGADKKEAIPLKKRFIIDTDDEEEGNAENKEIKLKKKSKRKRLEQRALQISDDEDEEVRDEDECESEIDGDEERLVEYDSEENEIELAPVPKKRKTTDFFEQEAELTSEDEWVGSGDEDEANLDVMEREEGDDEVFHQGKLQRELGQIHMRDVLDQDKREVRILQELLFEDGDLGDGHRQRKFRWKNMDGVEGDDNVITTFGESQEEDHENEAEWRKERHKREVFLRQMRKNEVDDISDLEISTATIKSNMNTSNEIEKSCLDVEKKLCKDIPSPRKPLGVFQSNYRGSLLSKGESSLARLAALATPLTADEDAPKTGLSKGKRNFVFSILSQTEDEVQVTKRKAETKEDSPRLIKKLKMNSKKALKTSLLDHLNS